MGGTEHPGQYMGLTSAGAQTHFCSVYSKIREPYLWTWWWTVYILTLNLYLCGPEAISRIEQPKGGHWLPCDCIEHNIRLFLIQLHRLMKETWSEALSTCQDGYLLGYVEKTYRQPWAQPCSEVHYHDVLFNRKTFEAIENSPSESCFWSSRKETALVGNKRIRSTSGST